MPLVAIAALLSCSGQMTVPLEPLQIDVSEPAYGQFIGDGPVRVAGQVSDPNAIVWVEGREVNVDASGLFAVEVEVGDLYRIIDVETARPDAHLRERLPVFSGIDPMETWPGAMPMRVTPIGLMALGDALEPTLEGLGLEDAIFGVIPSIETDLLTFIPIGLTRDPVDVVLVPTATGLQMDVVLTDVVFEADAILPLLGEDLIFVGFEEIVLGIEVNPTISSSGAISLGFGSSTVTLSDPILETGTLDPVVLEDLLAGALGGLGPLISGAVDLLLAGLGSIDLLGPLDFETDLLGTPLSISLDDLGVDEQGLTLVLGVGLGADATQREAPVPSVEELHWAAHAGLGLHEGLFQALLGSELLDLFSQDIELGGLLGNVLDLPVRALPGGVAAPPVVDGWCLALNPGEARVARMDPTGDDLAVLLLPDLNFNVGYQQGSDVCLPWLDASLALEIGLGLDENLGLALDIDVTDGAVLSYATTAEWTEPEVVDGLGALVELAVGLLGGSLGDLGGLDLGGLLGGGTGTGAGLPLGEIVLLGSEPVTDEDGELVPGLVYLSLRLF